MTQLFVSSRLFGAMTIAAGIDAGCFGGRSEHRRVLVVSHDAPIPELTLPPDQRPGYAPLLSRFDHVVSLNELIAPMHPLNWHPRPLEQPMFERLLRREWDLGSEPLELAVEAIQSNPARALAATFHDAAVTVYSDGLATYGATRATPPRSVGSRFKRLLHLDLVPGLDPHLLVEYGAPSEVVPDEAFLRIVDEVGADVAPLLTGPGPFGDNAALIVGQYFAELGILTDEEEDLLHVEMLRGVVARGHSPVLFKPHPHCPPRVFERLAAEAHGLGAELIVIDEPVPAEVWCAAMRPALIVGSFSTALSTAARYFDIPAMTLGTIRLLGRLTPYENSNRIPATIIDATLPRLTSEGGLVPPLIDPAEVKTELPRLLEAVVYCMQPGSRPELRGAAVDFLSDLRPGPVQRRYFRPRRLAELGLPGALPEQSHQKGLRRAKRLLTAHRRMTRSR